MQVSYKPVLFAGLLNHWGQKGPAEIPAKRRWTYRWCTWWARELGIPFRFPAAHPFNPLPYLRLALACRLPAHAIGASSSICGRPARMPPNRRASRSCAPTSRWIPRQLMEVKDALRKNTEEAAARGVFGVPSFVVDGEVFWGADAVDFLKAFLKDKAVLRNDEMRRVDDLPVGAARRT